MSENEIVSNQDSPDPIRPQPPEPVAKSPSKKPLIIVSVILCAVVAIGIWLVRQNKSEPDNAQETNQSETPSPEDQKQTTLEVNAAAATISSDLVTVPISIDTGKNTVSAVELHISVEPSAVAGLKVTPGSFFDSPTVLEDKAGDSPGTYIFTIGSLTPRQGSGVIALVSWTKAAGATGNVTVQLDEYTQVAAIGELGTVLKSMTDAVVRY